jgi:hypothetical protein
LVRSHGSAPPSPIFSRHISNARDADPTNSGAGARSLSGFWLRRLDWTVDWVPGTGWGRGRGQVGSWLPGVGGVDWQWTRAKVLPFFLFQSFNAPRALGVRGPDRPSLAQQCTMFPKISCEDQVGATIIFASSRAGKIRGPVRNSKIDPYLIIDLKLFNYNALTLQIKL